MRPAGLYHALVFRLESSKRRRQLVDGRQNLLFDRFYRRNVHRGRERVVGRLGHVDIVVRVQKLFACDFVAAVGDDLVGVHVRLRAGAGLPDDEGEVLEKLSLHDLGRRLLNGRQLLVRHFFGF